MNKSLPQTHSGDIMLLCRPTRHPEEGMYGFLLRLAEANGLLGIAQLLPGRKLSIDALERRLGAQRWPQNRIMLDPVLPQLNSRPGERPLWNKWHSRYCPYCLDESLRWQWEWELTLFTCCPRHGVELVERCPGCAKKLTWRRQSLAICDCGVSLTSAKTNPVSQSERKLVEVFYEKLYKLPPKHAHLSELSLEQLNRVAFMIGAYAKNNGRRFSQKISNLYDIDVARPLMHSAANVLMNWPREFCSLLASLRKAREIDIQNQRLSKRFGFFYHYVYRNLKEPEYSFLLQAFEAYISRTWRGSLADRNSRLSPDMRRRHIWVPIGTMAKELNTTKRKLQLLINDGRIESHVSETRAGRSLICVSRQQIVEMRAALDNVLDLQQTSRLLGLTKSRATQLMHGKVIESIFQPKGSGTSRWGIPHQHVAALVSLGFALPKISENERADLVSLAHALRYLLRERYLFPALILGVIHENITPVALSDSMHGLPGWLFNRAALVAWISEQRQVGIEDFLSVPDAARKLGIRQEATYQFIRSSQLRYTLHHERHHVLIYEKDLEEFASKFVFSHELQAKFNLLPAYFVPRLLASGVRPASGPGVDAGQIFLFSRDAGLFKAMDDIVKSRKCASSG